LHAAMQNSICIGHASPAGCMRPCKISEIEMPFALHVNFHSINANLGTCVIWSCADAPYKRGRREYEKSNYNLNSKLGSIDLARAEEEPPESELICYQLPGRRKNWIHQQLKDLL